MSAQTSAEAADSSATTTTNTTQDGSAAIDSHRCGTCKQEFQGLPEFLQHKLNTAACRDSELSDWWEQQKKTLLAQGQDATGTERGENTSQDVRSRGTTQAATGMEDTNDDMEEGEVRAGSKQRGATTQGQGPSSEDNPSATPKGSVTSVHAERRSARHAARQAMEAAKKSASTSSDEDSRSSTPNTCAICSKHFQNSYYLHKHELSHREGKTVECNKCNKFFRRPSDLRAHQRSHRSTRPYSCEVCGKSFKQQQVLRAHLKTHADSRDFKCPRCGDEFKTKGSLKRHERRHTGERPYKCNKCGRGFSESGALLRHHKALIPCTEKAKTSNFSQVRIRSVDNPDSEILVHHMTRSRTRNAGNVAAEDAGSAAGEDGDGAGDDGNGEAGDDGMEEAEPVAVELGMTSVEGQLEGVQVEEATTPAEVEEPMDNIEEGDSEGNDQPSPKEPPNQLQCRVCKMVHPNSDSLKVHLLTVHLQNVPFRCGLCAFCTGERSDLQKHMLVKHRRHLGEGQYLDVVQVDSQGNIQPLPRPHDKRMPEMAAGNTEEETAADLLGEAMANSGISSDETEMVNAAMQTEETSFDVEGNPAANAALEQLLELQHMTESTSQPPVQDGLHSHRAVHRCPHEGCNRSFRGYSYLRLHQRSHTGDRPFKCSICEGHFVSRDALKRHIVTHNDERRYKCGECGKLYKRISHVKEHLRVHCPDKPFQCPHCRKNYKTQSSLRVHLRTHDSDMPFSCEFCERNFREKASLVRHLRTHTGEKPFKCSKCNRGFAEHGTLRRHLRSKGGCRIATSSSQAQGMDAVDTSAAEEVPTVLVEFSSMVADTQSYIIQGSDHGQDGGTEGQTSQTIQVMEGVTNDQLVEALRMAQASGEVQEVQVQQGGGMDISDQHGASVVVTSEVVHIDPSVIMSARTSSAGDIHNLPTTAEMVPQVTVSEVMGQDGGQITVPEVMGHAGGEGLGQEVATVGESGSGMVNVVKLHPTTDDGNLPPDIETVVVEMH